MAMMFAACAKKDDSSSSSTTTTTTDSSMVTAMPSNLSVSSNTESGASVSSRTAGRTSSSEISDTSDPKKHKDKVARLEAVLNSDDINQCHKAIPKKMKGSGGSVNCFGPELAYVNHPSDNTTDGTLPTGDLGIWTAYSDNSTEEACSVGQMNMLLSKVGRKVDLAMGITAMMICAAKNDGLKKPAVDGDALDVTASVAKTKVTEKRGGMVITSATLNEAPLQAPVRKNTVQKLQGVLAIHIHSITVLQLQITRASKSIFSTFLTRIQQTVLKLERDWSKCGRNKMKLIVIVVQMALMS